jgi:hypothetical protein
MPGVAGEVHISFVRQRGATAHKVFLVVLREESATWERHHRTEEVGFVTGKGSARVYPGSVL